MKKILIALSSGLAALSVHAQQDFSRLDPRIDNQWYWKKMAERGLTKPNPTIPVAAAKYNGDAIFSTAIALPNSTDVLINNTAGSSQSENSMAISPINRLRALNSNNSTNAGAFLGTSSFLTTNQGATWNGTVNSTGGNNSGDPAAAIGNDNRHYVGFITPAGGQGVAVSTNQGATWQAFNVAPAGGFLDKNHLTVDKSPSSPFQNNVYAAWTDFGGANNNRIVLARSVNGGVNWGAGINISAASAGAGGHDQGVNIQTGPNGEVYAVWAIYDAFPADERALGFAASANGGVNFAPAARIINNIRGIRNTGVGKNMRVNSFPSMAVDNSFGPNRGSIYVVWTNIGVPGVNTGTDTDVYLIRSRNGGATWSAPALVHTRVANAGRRHYFPWITCDQTTGKLHVVYYDDRNVTAAQCETWASSSADGGLTWDDYRISDVAFTPGPIPGLATGYFGDYLGIAANDDVIYPVWTDNRSGTARAYTSPLISADLCSPSLSLQNITMPNAATFRYRASATITTAGGGTGFVMQSGARASMVAAGSITLQPNTNIQTGSVLSIQPGACSSPLLRTNGGGADLSQPVTAEEAELGVVTQFMLYPNPASQTVTLRLAKSIQPSATMRYAITTLMGELLLQDRVTETVMPISIGSLKPGGYFLNIYDNGKLLESKKLVKQ